MTITLQRKGEAPVSLEAINRRQQERMTENMYRSLTYTHRWLLNVPYPHPTTYPVIADLVGLAKKLLIESLDEGSNLRASG